MQDFPFHNGMKSFLKMYVPCNMSMKKPTRNLPGWVSGQNVLSVLHKVSQLRAGNTPNLVFFAGKLPETYDHEFLTDPSLMDRTDHMVHFKILQYADL